MPTTLDLASHLDALREASASLLERSRAVRLGTRVPTCPSWTSAHLVAHQTHFHRWATAHLRGTDPGAVPSQTRIRREQPDLLGHFAAGAAELERAVAEADDDLDALVFLLDAPAPRHFWTRRQAHETTVHAVDALAAVLRRTPTAAETGVPTDLAVDGIDELLCGFLPRTRSRLRSDEPFSLLLAPEDADRAWRVEVGTGPPRTSTGPGSAALSDADAVLHGSATQLYLGLWNRGDEVVAEGRPGALATWRALARVR